MQLDNKHILIAVIVIALLALPAAAFAPTAIRVVLTIPFILFFPGYTLLSVLYPRRGTLDSIERIAVSFGLSIVVVPLIGLILNFTPFGITLLPILVLTTIFIILCSVLALYRQRGLPPGKRLSVSLVFHLPPWQMMGSADRVLSLALALAIISLLGYFIYFIVTPDQGERYTEFYILSTVGIADYYPTELVAGESLALIAGIVNHEYADTSYRVVVRMDGQNVTEVLTGPQADGENWQQTVSFVPHSIGDNQKVEFLLYRNDESTPYHNKSLHLYIDVIGVSSNP